jgi:CheY-like chemotaxis protein/HPt (histidine-containing phosphotransfer) domain-containing protein
LIVAELLRAAGHEVEAVADGRAAVEAVFSRPFDVALIDVQMPELDGPSAVAEIRRREREEHRPRLPIAALTADAMPRDSRSLEQAGFDTKLTKPISAAALLAAIDALVGNAVPHSPFPIPHSPLQPVDSASALERLRGNEELLAELQEMFASEAATAIDRLRSGIAAGDDEAVFQTAHRLRGQLLLLGAEEAAEIAEAIESASHAGRAKSAAARLEELAASLERISPAGKP